MKRARWFLILAFAVVCVALGIEGWQLTEGREAGDITENKIENSTKLVSDLPDEKGVSGGALSIVPEPSVVPGMEEAVDSKGKEDPKASAESNKMADSKTKKKNGKAASEERENMSAKQKKNEMPVSSKGASAGKKKIAQEKKIPGAATETVQNTALPEQTPLAETPLQKKECSLVISCREVFSHMDRLSEGAKRVIPGEGTIWQGTAEIREGDTAFDVLKRVCSEHKIALDYEFTPLYSSYYIKGIGQLYEFDCGDESGWMYSVNGVQPGFSCSQYKLQEGDSILFNYTCER